MSEPRQTPPPLPPPPAALQQVATGLSAASGVVVSPPREPAASDPASRRRRRQPSELLIKVRSRPNEFLDFVRGKFAGRSWGTSLLLHAIILTALGTVLLENGRQSPDQVLTTPTDPGPIEDVGGFVDEALSLEVGEITPALTGTDVVTVIGSGGSGGATQPDVAGAFGLPAGLGLGTGTGSGVGAGMLSDSEIVGRVAAAGGQGGILQISLAWSNRNDLDLHLITPDDERIFYGKREGPAGGELDVDMNVEPESDQPVENITWKSQRPIEGRYRIQVHFYAHHRQQPDRSPFTVRLQLGKEVRMLKGIATPGRLSQVAEFEVGGSEEQPTLAKLKQLDSTDTAVILDDARRVETREKAAVEALRDARSTPDLRLRAGKLRRIIQRFQGTNAAQDAQRMLDQIPQS